MLLLVYFIKSVFFLARYFSFWKYFFSGAGIAYFEEIITSYVALVFFLPLLIDSGGNAGSQSATLMVRALATGDVHPNDWGRMLAREMFVALGLGFSMAIAVYFFWGYIVVVMKLRWSSASVW